MSLGHFIYFIFHSWTGGFCVGVWAALTPIYVLSGPRRQR